MCAQKNPSAMSEESIDILGDVRKGKPRRFVALCKGSDILSLVVFKKGSVESKKTQAKAAGAGTLCWGVVTGKGQDLNFQLARSDGFDKAPTRTSALKTFLSEHAELTCKPLWEIVDSPSVVLDDDDPLAKRFLALKDAALAAAERVPERADELNQLCLNIGRLLQDDQRDAAEAKIVELEALLRQLGPAATPTSGEGTGPQPLTDVLAKLNQLSPLIKSAVANHPGKRGDLSQLVLTVKTTAEAGDADNAKVALTALAAMLRQLGPATGGSPQEAPASKPDTGDANQWQQEFAAAEARVLEALRANPANATQIRGVLEFARARGAEGQIDRGRAALAKLATLLNTTGSSSGGDGPVASPVAPTTTGKGLVQKRRELLKRWVALSADLNREFASLRQIVAAEAADPDPDELVEALAEAVGTLQDELRDALDASIQSGDATYAETVKQIGLLRTKVTGHELIRHLQSHPLMSNARFEALLMDALSDFEQQLAS